MERGSDRRVKQDGKTTRMIFIRLCRYVLRYWYLFVPAIVMTLLANQLSLLGPKYSGMAIDAIAASGGTNAAAIRSRADKNRAYASLLLAGGRKTDPQEFAKL